MYFIEYVILKIANDFNLKKFIKKFNEIILNFINIKNYKNIM